MSGAAAIVRAAACAMTVAWVGVSCDGPEPRADPARETHPSANDPASGATAGAGVATPVAPPARSSVGVSPRVLAPVASVGSGVGAPAAGDGIRRLIGEGPDEDSVLFSIAQATPWHLRSIGTTSVVLKLDLGDRGDAAFKPRTRLHPKGWLAEIAAYRVARCLGLDNVPAAATRTLRREQLRERLVAEDAADLSSLESSIVWNGDTVPGAAIQWIRGLTSLGLERDDRRAEWSAWLSQTGAPAPAEHAELARDLSNAFVFDYLIGNIDRWSGGNLGGTPDGRRLYLRDHNLAFVSLGRGQSARLWQGLGQVERLSRSLVLALRRLDAPQLRDELVRDSGLRDRPRLVDEWVRDVLGRREAVLSHVAALIDEYGVARVLAFR